MEKWRRVWRNGFAPQMSKASLQALLAGLVHDDINLMQGVTCYPPLWDELSKSKPCQCACVIAYSGWKGENQQLVGEVEAYFSRLCDASDDAFNEPASSRYFLNWVDDTPRENMRRELIQEINLVLTKKEATEVASEESE